MNEFDIPIFKKSYELYKTLHEFRRLVPKQDRFSIFERVDATTLDIIEGIILASGQQKVTKLPALERTSIKLNMLRVFVRLMKDTKAIDNKKYAALEATIDEIGRMLGGWIRSIRVE
ncbi:MAG: hypothetical protein A3C93_02255 [Candidatus Lloydbacteria bacterium RIFCSPHIGHO2_02_FULL_54_17]|uniref:bAvd-like domain-containing protein n=1 Tax=Candidatus Lloydbacteria bacterium RIFCSPHIGHO2_02_FULL_54_17 TaxID=1798664 RepID=A0A1G2DDM3_9BACT|nr:MAG: hypothetical protein A2762_02155 [Candidatus Lloydbacteria bacterium RIFCSPHIGHO2_01_FULL_54_11]OGZ11735.1 MAG: hypothetical protein A3C93_02255 [Candidatus Lloydbacteria bacterium RIFCSPHIGHO2_02_FULL_54_17]OGZ14264.1 MAG: hypothetical protein A2948_01590 [Candidatus Lloydbacteria bacterium RIFCSPLOWO2_01_FULL_54_18]OGZ16608.1 MAG: hypothetical protein A3H76_04225 [Candidatus Lloydbacteria bacterium RIFCSPLOWO2_02_FULL_54_12]